MGELIGIVSGNKNGLATPSMYKFKPYINYSSHGCYNLGVDSKTLIFGGRDLALGAYFVRNCNDIINLTSHNTIKFYKDEIGNVFAYVETGFNITAINLNVYPTIQAISSFNPENYTEILPR